MKRGIIIRKKFSLEKTKTLEEAKNTLLMNCGQIWEKDRPINEFNCKEMAKDVEPVARLLERIIEKYGTK